MRHSSVWAALVAAWGVLLGDASASVGATASAVAPDALPAYVIPNIVAGVMMAVVVVIACRRPRQEP